MKRLKEKIIFKNIIMATFILLLSGCASSPDTSQKKLTIATSNESSCYYKVYLYESIINNNDDFYKTYQNGKGYSTPEQVTQAIEGIKTVAPNCYFGNYGFDPGNLIDTVIILQRRKDPRAFEIFEVLLQNMKNKPQPYKKEANSSSDWYMKYNLATLSETLSHEQANRLFAVATTQDILSKKDVTFIKKEGSKGVNAWLKKVRDQEDANKKILANQSAQSNANAGSSGASTWIAALGGVASVAGAVDSRNSAAYSKLGAELMRSAAEKETNSKTAKGYSDVANMVDKRTQSNSSCDFKRKTLGDATRMCQCQKGKIIQKDNYVGCQISAESGWGCTRFDDGKLQCAAR